MNPETLLHPIEGTGRGSDTHAGCDQTQLITIFFLSAWFKYLLWTGNNVWLIVEKIIVHNKLLWKIIFHNNVWIMNDIVWIMNE